ncbi:TPA: hypothetical protein ACYLN4_006219 [Burkholderia lata]
MSTHSFEVIYAEQCSPGSLANVAMHWCLAAISMGMTANKLPQIIVSFARPEKANLEPIWQDEIGRL